MKTMARTQRETVVGVFESHSAADRAVDELRRAGFREDQIGFAARDGKTQKEGGTYAGEGALAGVAAGAGIGGLIGLGVLSGVLPVIGPAIAAGTLGVILANAAAGAAIAGLAGTLIGWGVSEDDAKYYESEFTAGKTVVTVSADGRDAEARSILRRFGATSRGGA